MNIVGKVFVPSALSREKEYTWQLMSKSTQARNKTGNKGVGSFQSGVLTCSIL